MMFGPLLVLLLPGIRGFSVNQLDGVKVTTRSKTEVDVGEVLKKSETKTLVIFGTYAADFNMIEYVQRCKAYGSQLREAGCGRTVMIVNAEPEATEKLCEVMNLEDVEVLSDPTGTAGRVFGVGRGWLPETDSIEIFGQTIPISPFAKLFGMLWGLGAWATLPAVIGGYLGNPVQAQPWIDVALKENSDAGRWPAATSDKFAALPVVGSWGRRPLELATLRLQNMLGISLKYWEDLRPLDANLKVLTQLGGCCVLDESGSKILYEWRDPGICAVAKFEDILAAL